MTNTQPSNVGPQKVGPRKVGPRKSDPLSIALIVGLVLLVLAGVALLAAYFLGSRPAPAPITWINPLDGVRKGVAPDLAVLPLAGEPDDRVVRAALDAGEVETAYAALAYGALLPDNVRGGHWVLLAERFAPAESSGQGDRARAALSYRAALDTASLSPNLSDVVRASLSLQAARGFASLGRNVLAQLALVQAENIGRYSLTLLPAQRRDILNQVAAGYRNMGETQVATALQAKLSDASAGPGVKAPPPVDYMAQLRGSIVLPADLTAAIVARQAAAATLAARWLGNTGTRAELAEALGAALVAEDGAREQFYTQAGDLNSADQLALLHDKIAWLLVKYRAARGAYGVSLVPDWEGHADLFAEQLATAYTDLINSYGRELDTLDPVEGMQGRMQLLQQGLLWVRLGLFPDHAEQALSAQLGDAARQLWTGRGGAGLIVVSQEVEGARFYLLSGGSPHGT